LKLKNVLSNYARISYLQLSGLLRDTDRQAATVMKTVQPVLSQLKNFNAVN